MKLNIYQVDAFTDTLFSGNPAAVCPLTKFLPDDMMQSIAAENNLSETVFFIPKEGAYEIRWFTPKTEVNLCGHATLAAAYIIFNELDKSCREIIFHSKSGPLYVTKSDHGLIQLNFPAKKCEPVEFMPELMLELTDALGDSPNALYRSENDYLAIYTNEEQIALMSPDFNKLLQLDLRGVIVSSTSEGEYDFVSRFFAPQCGISEDPVTGSAHTILAPFWSKALGISILKARQLSARGGELLCEVKNDRVYLTGSALIFLKGEIYIRCD